MNECNTMRKDSLKKLGTSNNKIISILAHILCGKCSSPSTVCHNPLVSHSNTDVFQEKLPAILLVRVYHGMYPLVHNQRTKFYLLYVQILSICFVCGYVCMLELQSCYQYVLFFLMHTMLLYCAFFSLL
jgi:hypothetical protein